MKRFIRTDQNGMSKAPEYTDKELVDGCIRNDRRFQEVLYKKYCTRMMQMCMRYTNDQDLAMEIVNTGFLRVFKKLETFSFKGSLEGWIRKLVYHSLSEHYKKNKKYMQQIVLEEKDSSIREEALGHIYAEDILKMVELLPPATQRVFRLYAIEGFTHPEISKQINISVGTSKWHLAAARKKLQELITNKNNYRLYAG